MKKLLLILLVALVAILIWDLLLIYHSNAVPSQIEQDTTPIVPIKDIQEI